MKTKFREAIPIITIVTGLTGVHEVLGAAHVRQLLRLQHRGPPQHAHSHDVQLLPAHLREVGQVRFSHSNDVQLLPAYL